MTLKIDGNEYSNIVVSVKRKAELKPTEVAGFLLNREYCNDLMGTYMTYEVKVAVPRGHESEYATLYEVLTTPTASHVFILPYNQSTITITGRVSTVSDEYYKEIGGVIVWRRTTFNIISNSPSKVPV